MTKEKIFVSYSSEDREEVNNLVTFLYRLDVEVIIDKEFLRPPNPIGEKLREQIRKSDGCVWVFTENSVKSKWCPVELGAFWGAGKPVIIYSPSKVKFEPFSNIKHAENFADIEEGIKEWESEDKTLATVPIREVEKLIKKNVKSATHGLSKEVTQLREHLPVLNRMMDFVGTQNTFLPNHAALLSKITEIVERAPKKLTCAFDVPSFGSVSAESDYRKCCEAFNKYITNDEWDMTIRLLPADVGITIVDTEFTRLQKRKQAWVEDIRALRRFQRYEGNATERGRRNFKIEWLAVNRDTNGAPLGLHSMPLNIWIFNHSEAVFSTVIDNYRPTGENSTDSGSQVKEIGFSTTNRDMVRFLAEITEKYARNIDETITLNSQIEASEEAKAQIERSILAQRTTGESEE